MASGTFLLILDGADFRDEMLSIQNLKASFVFLLWLETKLSILYGPSTSTSFINWVGCVCALYPLYSFNSQFQ